MTHSKTSAIIGGRGWGLGGRSEQELFLDG